MPAKKKIYRIINIESREIVAEHLSIKDITKLLNITRDAVYQAVDKMWRCAEIYQIQLETSEACNWDKVMYGIRKKYGYDTSKWESILEKEKSNGNSSGNIVGFRSHFL